MECGLNLILFFLKKKLSKCFNGFLRLVSIRMTEIFIENDPGHFKLVSNSGLRCQKNSDLITALSKQ